MTRKYDTHASPRSFDLRAWAEQQLMAKRALIDAAKLRARGIPIPSNIQKSKIEIHARRVTLGTSTTSTALRFFCTYCGEMVEGLRSSTTTQSDDRFAMPHHKAVADAHIKQHVDEFVAKIEAGIAAASEGEGSNAEYTPEAQEYIEMVTAKAFAKPKGVKRKEAGKVQQNPRVRWV